MRTQGARRSFSKSAYQRAQVSVPPGIWHRCMGMSFVAPSSTYLRRCCMCTRSVDAPSKSAPLQDLIAATISYSTTPTSSDHSCLHSSFTEHDHNLTRGSTPVSLGISSSRPCFSTAIFPITITRALGGFFFRVNLVTWGIHA